MSIKQIYEVSKISRPEGVRYIYLFTFGSDRVNLVDKDDGGRILLRLLEGFAEVTLTFTSHLTHNLRTIDQEEECASFVRDRTCHERLTGTWRSIHEDTARRLDTNGLEELRVTQWQLNELSNLGYLFAATTDIIISDIIEIRFFVFTLHWVTLCPAVSSAFFVKETMTNQYE